MSATLVQNSTTSKKQQQNQEQNSAANDIRLEQLATYSLMLQYDIDNTLNTFKEQNRIKQMQQHAATATAAIATEMKGATETEIETMNAAIYKKIINDNKEQMGNTNNYNNNNNSKNNHKNNNTQVPLMQPITVDTKDEREQELELELEEQDNVHMPPTPPVTPNLQNTAQKRWRILAKVLRKDSEETVSSSSDEFSDEQTASVRRFKSFDLLRQDSFEDHMSLKCLGKTENWYKYRMLLENDTEYSVNIHHMERHLTANDLMGFNNTGNICVWPSEEALTALLLSDLEAYHGKWILELGGGFTSLAGLMLAKYAKPYAVHLTDGNEVSVENVRKTVCLNELSCYTKCSVLKWQDRGARATAECSKFDIILCADCLFFDEARTALVETIWYYLAPGGLALIMAPRRGKTMNLFREECQAKGFAVELATRYNETIWQRHLQLKQESDLYDEDLHYPLLLRLIKLGS